MGLNLCYLPQLGNMKEYFLISLTFVGNKTKGPSEEAGTHKHEQGLLFSFLVNGLRSAPTTELFEFYFARDCFFVFTRCVVRVLAYCASQPNYLFAEFSLCHTNLICV